MFCCCCCGNWEKGATFNDVYTDGGLVCNYPIHVFDGKCTDYTSTYQDKHERSTVILVFAYSSLYAIKAYNVILFSHDKV